MLKGSVSTISLGAALGLLALASSGCFLFKKSEPPPEPVAVEEPPPPPCTPPGAPGAPEGTSVLSMTQLQDEALPGTVVYSLYWERMGGGYVEVGQPLSVCSVRSMTGRTTTLEGEAYELTYPVRATVMDSDGKTFEFPVEGLSTTPPLLSMANPGKVEELAKTAFIHAYEIQMARYVILKNYTNERLEPAKKVGEAWEVNWDYHAQLGLDSAGEYASKVVWAMAHGGMGRETLLSHRQYAWVARAEDDRIVDWYNEGAKDGPDGKAYEAMSDCISALDSVNTSLMSIGSIEQERREKRWREDVPNASEAQLAKYDAAEEKKLDGRKQTAQSFIDEHFDSKKCKLAREFVGIPAPQK